MKTFEELKNEFTENTRYDIITSVTCSSGRANLTLVDSEIKYSDKGEVVFRTLVLADGTEVHLSFLAPEESGFYSVPFDGSDSKVLYGKDAGSLKLNSVMGFLPSIYTDKVAAEKYLANNPEMLISKVSNVLGMQKSIMKEQEHILSHLDWDLSCVYDQATAKTKKFMKLILNCKADSGYLSKLKGLFNGDEFTN